MSGKYEVITLLFSIFLCLQISYNLCNIYFSSEVNMKLACNIPKEAILSLGNCFGKFTKSLQFKHHITALDYIVPYAKHKIWLKANAEQQFLYSHNIFKTGLARISENTIKYRGV
ncbi:60S ribosome subunit biogenesis protein NIP7-like protein, partial [Stegodyphus mimosarum]